MINPPLVDALIMKYKGVGVLVDTNLMLLLVVGIYDLDRITTFKRTLKYRASDFQLLHRILASFDRIVTTPNIVTEVDNLLRQLPEKEHPAAAGVLAKLCDTVFERYVASNVGSSDALFFRIGMTDVITIILTSEPYLVVTDDFELANRLQHLGRDVININHIRTFK